MSLSDPIERIAKSGNVAAMTALGKELLIGTGPQQQQGASLLASAAEKGGAEAACLIAVLIAAGAPSLEHWSAAFNWLFRAAELGWAPAQAQLRLFAGDGGSPSTDWAQLRKAIDIPAVLAAPAMKEIVAAPRLCIVENFAAPTLCDWMIEHARPFIARARTFDASTGGGQADPDRTNSAASFDILRSDLVLLVLRARIAQSTGHAAAMLEETNVLHYAPGEEFKRHFDFLDPATPAIAEEIRAKGQRVSTFLLYLNDDYAGGETEFAALGRRHRGAKGDALFFSNVTPAKAPDTLTLHAGLATTTGEKWLLSQWIRGVAG